MGDVVNVISPSATSFGFWGAHGFAGAVIGAGALSGEARPTALGVQTTIPFEGDLSFALAFATGDVTSRNPTGIGNATWEGIVEAASTRTFERRPGTVQLLIANLSQPNASVEIKVDGVPGRSHGMVRRAAHQWRLHLRYGYGWQFPGRELPWSAA